MPRHAPIRETRQRQAIREVLDAADRPLSPLEVLGHAKSKVPRLGLATVYRTLKALVDERWLVPVSIPGESPHYERAGKAHHHHFHCRGCGGVFEVHGCPGDLKPLAPQGFRVEGHELILYGVCRRCRAAS
ncbi:MAG: transcriptional repressor [Phycisphaeraceae bacterium]|nr:transcriptional repressor [Phycisphaeraceae bacterium]